MVGDISKWWKNRTFCSFDTSQRAKDDNWKQVFHFKQDILKSLLDDNRNLEDICKEFTDVNDWRYGFIHFPEILQYCTQYQIRMKSDKDIIVLSKQQTNGLHAEYYTFWLYLEIKNKYSNIKYVDQSSIELSKYISIDNDTVKISYNNYDNIYQYEVELNGEYEYFEDKNKLIASLIKEKDNDLI